MSARSAGETFGSSAEAGSSMHTLAAYRSDLERACETLASLSEASPDDLARLGADWSKLAPSTVARRAAAVGNSPDAVAWSVFATASGSRSGISLNRSEFQRVNVVLPEPFAPAMKVNVGRVTAREMRTSSGAQRESLSSDFSRWQHPHALPGPAFAPFPSSSQP